MNGSKYIKFFAIAAVICLLVTSWIPISSSQAQSGIPELQPTRRVNLPYLGVAPPAANFTPAIFWFGSIDSISNYADVRAWYFDGFIDIYVNIIDRRLWYDTSPAPSDLTNWDAISIYFKLDGNSGNAPTNKTFRFDSQLNFWEPRSNWQASYIGNGSGWQLTNIPFTTESGYRFESNSIGGLNINQNNRGWTMEFKIPFTSLGLQGKPSQNTVWGFSAVLHDRDDQTGTSIPDQTWPELMQPNLPSTWGQMQFGMPAYTPPIVTPSSNMNIRNGLNGAVVKDGEVGGHTTCSENLWPDIFNTFGQANYAGITQINIQNQWDLSDWSCFSKYYITFPLNSIPAGQQIISANLSMYLFGGSAGNPNSYIQVFTVDKDWNEATLNWNNASLAIENIAGTWVYPISSPYWVEYKWDVSRAAAQAKASGQPLRLALYSADGEYHTGKYFISSDGDYAGRPTLQVVYGSVCGSPSVTCKNYYFPVTRR